MQLKTVRSHREYFDWYEGGAWPASELAVELTVSQSFLKDRQFDTDRQRGNLHNPMFLHTPARAHLEQLHVGDTLSPRSAVSTSLIVTFSVADFFENTL